MSHTLTADRAYTREVARYVAGLRYEDLPADVVDHIKLCLLDTIGCGLFGSTLLWGELVTTFAQTLGTGPDATIWGAGALVPAANAALANGTLIHSFELDDLHKIGIIHPGAETVPAALALAERQGSISGQRFLAACVAGYEIGSRVGIAAGASQLRRGFHPSATSGTFSAAAAGAVILGFDNERTLHALGIAGTQASGLMSAQFSSMVKRFHLGRSSQSGVYGVQLAEIGFTGIPNVLEADYGGFLSTYSDDPHPEVLLDGLGERYETLNVGFKPYACCGSNHTSLDALNAILAREPAITVESVDRITVHATRATMLHVGWEYQPDSITAAQMNLPYSLAVRLLDGACFVDQFTPERIASQDAIALSRRVDVVEDERFNQMGDKYRHAIEMEVRLRTGRTLREEVHHARGSAFNPLPPADVESKYMDLASRVIGPERAADLRETIAKLETMDDVGALAAMLVT